VLGVHVVEGVPRRRGAPGGHRLRRRRPDGGGFAVALENAGPLWAATMRLADPLALHRSAVGLARGTDPTMRVILESLDIPRTFLVGESSEDVAGRAGLVAAGVDVVTVPGAGHCLMFDDPRAYAAAISGS
jgi:pimeloyl-ACP methyl ester carboxylesterase